LRVIDGALPKGSLGKESERAFEAIRLAGGAVQGEEKLKIKEYTEKKQLKGV
jgi:hypothetical protein